MNTETTIETQSTEPVEAPPKLIDLELIAHENSNEHSHARHFRAQAAIQISDINQDGSDQFRTATRPAQVEMMKGLIIDGMKFTTPIRLRTDTWHRQLKIMDGHHRIEAYKALGRTEIPIEQIEIVETRSYVAEKLLPMKANTTNGLTNTYADFYKMLSYIAAQAHGFGELKRNAFELDIPTIALNISASKKVLEAIYNRYTGLKDAPHPTLSQQLKAKRDEAIIEAYGEGISGNAIAKKFNIKSHKTVLKVIEDHEAAMAEAERRWEEDLAERKRRSAIVAERVGLRKDAFLSWDEIHDWEEQLGIGDGNYEDTKPTKPSAPPVELPMADTSDRSATRADMGEILAKHMAKVDRLEERRIVEENGRLVEYLDVRPPTDAEIKAKQFDIKSLGWGDGPGTNAKAVKIADMDAEKLQDAWKQNQIVKKRADRKQAELLEAAARLGISLED